MTEKLGIDVFPMDSLKKCVENADIVICATNSLFPVLEVAWLKQGVHINTVGSTSIILYYLILNIFHSPQYPWVMIFPAFAVLWWPLSYILFRL